MVNLHGKIAEKRALCNELRNELRKGRKNDVALCM